MLTYALIALGGYLAHGALRVVRTKPKGAKAKLRVLCGGSNLAGGPGEEG